MSLSGSLDDVSVADVMQFINLGGRSGTLTLKVGVRHAEIGFHRGRIISARGADHLPLGEWLVSKGAISPRDIDAALRIQKRMATPTAIGKILVEMDLVSIEQLKQLVEEQIQSTVYGVVGWTGGTFEFSVDELKPIDDLSMSPGDILPDININTQMVLLEAARILDERNRAQAANSSRTKIRGAEGSERPTDASELAPPPRKTSDRVAVEAKSTTVRAQLVSTDHDLYLQISQALCVNNAAIARISPRDAGTRLPGEAAPVVLVDIREGVNAPALLATIRRTRSRAILIAIVDDVTRQLDAYDHGAVAVVPANAFAIAACVANVLQLADSTAPTTGSLYARAPELAKLNRVFGELRSGLMTATVSLNLMNLVSESVERAVLFVAAPTRLVVLGAHGYTALEQSLAEHTRNYWIGLEAGGALSDTLRDGRSRTLAYEDARLPESFTTLIGRPSSGSCAVFPLLGSRKVIATMYVDNGRRHTPIDDTELLEIATSQVGMFYENELLRRQLASYAQSSGTTTKAASK